MAQHKHTGQFDVETGLGWSLSQGRQGRLPDFLDLPHRAQKPRQTGLTIAIDPGLPTALFRDTVESHGDIIDVIKLGWGTAVVTSDLSRKLDILRMHGIEFFFGGTLFEKSLQQDRVADYFDYCADVGCRWVEVSNGTLDIAPADKARYIAAAAERFQVMSEVGYKDDARSEQLSAADWIALISSDFAAGARLVVTEARESGTSGICRADGGLRDGLIEAILDSGIEPDSLVFEAPNKSLHSYFVRLLGCNANLGNIAFADLIGLETLRQGLRSDTLLQDLNGNSRDRRTP